MRNFFEKGTIYKDFFDAADDKYKLVMENILKCDSISEEIFSKIKNIDKEIKFLVVGEAWCPDCIINISVLECIKKINNNIDYKIISKNQAKSGNEFEKYYIDNKLKIPTILFLNSNYEAIDSFIEKPQIMKYVDLLSEENQVERIVKTKNYRNGKYVEETMKEISDMIFNKK